jgi:hypothetical protein
MLAGTGGPMSIDERICRQSTVCLTIAFLVERLLGR